MRLSPRQKILKFVYPLILWFSRVTGRHHSVVVNADHARPKKDFYDLSLKLVNGSDFSFEQLKGKKVMLVNTASNCGYTRQYEELQQLHRESGGKLAIIAVPSNDFKDQEPEGDASIAAFCTNVYSLSFPVASKTVVTKKDHQHPLYRWLTDPAQNGWNSQEPKWNFSKFLLNEQGVLTHYFDPGISPMGTEVRKALEA